MLGLQDAPLSTCLAQRVKLGSSQLLQYSQAVKMATRVGGGLKQDAACLGVEQQSVLPQVLLLVFGPRHGLRGPAGLDSALI